LGLGRTALAGQDSSTRGLAAERLRAMLDGMALAVLVVPEDPAQRRHLETAWDRFLVSVRPEELVDLGLVRRTLATRAELEALTCGIQGSLSQDAALVLLETGSAPAVLPTTELPPGMDRAGVCGSTTDRQLARTLAKFLHPDLAAVRRRRARFEAVLFLEPERLRDQETRNLAAAWRLREEAESAGGRRRSALLAKAAKLLLLPLRKSPLSRPLWRTQVPPRSCAGGPCGTGFFSPTGRRFVKFWVAAQGSRN